MKTPRLTFRKRTIFTLITISLALVTSEIGLHLMYELAKGKFVWQREEFFIRDYEQLVNDERYVTAKPNYRNANYQDGTAPWDIEIDSSGFRAGSNRVSKGGPNIVFIGDSVPFGYGIGSQDTVPSKLQDILVRRLDSRGVINAAFPSYSLDQAVHRYKYEIAGRYDIEVVILQIYDPASQFAMLGREWDVSKNWVTYPEGTSKFSFLHYSSLLHLFSYFHETYLFEEAEQFDINDQIAMNKYVASINASMHVLKRETEGRVNRVFVLPATPPPKSWAILSKPHKVALTVLNQTLQGFAKQQAYMQFIDTNELFASDKEGLGFIDECCHLSPDGAARVANLIAANL